MSTSTQAYDAHAPAGPAPRPLSELRPGSRAIITAIGAASPPAARPASHAAAGPQAAPRLTRRLQDLGMVPGRTVEVLRRAPLGDPTVFLVADYELCLRKRDAALVQVTPLTGAEGAVEMTGEAGR